MSKNSVIAGLKMSDIARILPSLTEQEKLMLLEELTLLDKLKTRELAQNNFIEFVKQIWPEYIHGDHFARMADAFERIANGTLKRLTISMPPRHGKSYMASYLFPAWYMGKFPNHKIMQASHTTDLAVGFGRQVRNLLDTPTYQNIFPGVELRADSKAAGRWNTNHNGDYNALGALSAAAGKGAHLFIVDDPVSEQEALLAESNPDIYERVYEWFLTGPRQRMQAGGAIIIVMTRWSKEDLVGKVLKAEAQRQNLDEDDPYSWEVIEFPAILNVNTPDERPLWPEMWSIEDMRRLRDEMPTKSWMAQYMQTPTSDVTSIIKRDWWRKWEDPNPPKCDSILMAWDTAFETTNRADYSACTTWGVFYHPDARGKEQAHLILLNAFKDKLEFPDLKRKAVEQYHLWEPDSMIIEKKASGAPLIYELRSMGIPVQEFTPVRGNDKVVRLNAIADIFASGRVWAPPTRWAEDVIEEVASFGGTQHDDYVDSTSLALMRFRQGGYVKTDLDEEDEIPMFKSQKSKGYY